MKKSLFAAILALVLHGCAPGTPAFAGVSGRVPTEAPALNGFVAQYNAYIGELQAGKVDVKQWRRVEEAWQRLR